MYYFIINMLMYYRKNMLLSRKIVVKVTFVSLVITNDVIVLYSYRIYVKHVI